METDRTAQPNKRGRIHPFATLLLAVGLLVAVFSPATAGAKRGLTTGFDAVEQYQSTDPSVRKVWFDRTVDAQAGLVRLSLGWAYFAPTRPADPTNPASYDLSSIDGAVRDAEARGLRVMITVNVAPAWAEGPDKPPDFGQGSTSGGAGAWKPNPSDVADFMQALAARYSGSFDPDGPGGQPSLPAVQALEVWNESNSSDWLAPQFDGKSLVGVELYRTMLNASYKAIKSVNPNVQVVAGGTDPYGDPPGGPYPPGVQRIQPVSFWQQLLCVKPKKRKGKQVKYVRAPNCPAKANFDVLSHHPIDNTGKGPLQHGPRPGDASTPDLGRVVSVLRAAEKLGTVSSGRHPVWVTEFFWDSKPPNPAGARLATQARWIEQSLYLFWKAGASAAINFEITDIAARPDVRAGFQSGVYFSDGRPKPSLTAFKFPFVTGRTSKSTLQAWGKAPEAGQLKIQRQQGGSWITIKKLRATKGGVFVTKLRLRGKQRLRATVGGSKSLVWKQTAAGARASGGRSSLPGFPVLLAIAAASLFAVGFARRRQLVRRRRRRRPRPATAGTG